MGGEKEGGGEWILEDACGDLGGISGEMNMIKIYYIHTLSKNYMY